MGQRQKMMVAALASVAIAATTGLIVNDGSAADAAKPSNLDPPVITGTPEVGQTLTATEGRWSGNPTDINLQWRRCDENGGSCANISGAAGKTYVLKSVDAANTLRVSATAKNGEGVTSATSVPTAVVRQATTPPAAKGCTGTGTSVAVADLSPPDRLNVDRVDTSPGVVGRSSDHVVARVKVSACNGKAVQGALVYVTAVPYNQFSVPPEATTGADGTAQLTMNRLRGYPATPHQQLLVMFVRARKQGENKLGGISTRRLVSVRVDLKR
jgi:hypothetical protein